jgi:hypothetical protein
MGIHTSTAWVGRLTPGRITPHHPQRKGVQLHRGAHHARVRAEGPHPEVVPQHHRLRLRSRRALRGREEAPHRRPRPHHVEERQRGAGQRHALGAARPNDRLAARDEYAADRLQRAAVLLEVQVPGRGHAPPIVRPHPRNGAVQPHQLPSPRVGKRAQDDAVQQGEHGGGGADPQRHREHRHRGEAGAAPQGAGGRAEELKGRLHVGLHRGGCSGQRATP